MAREITHTQDETGRMVQVVTPDRLREILCEDGDSLDRPDHFGADDEWDVAEWDRDPNECPHGIYRGANVCPACDAK